METSAPDQKQKLHDLLAKFEVATLVTHADDGMLRGRPMQIAQVDDACRVWFFSQEHSGKVDEIEKDRSACVVCQRDRDIYLSLTGIATLTHDRAKIDELWKEGYKVWFPGGKDDPDLVVLCVVPSEGEYWDQAGANKIKYLFETAKAYATGTQPHIQEGEQHAKVKL